MNQELNSISSHRQHYERRFQRVLEYVHQHLERDLDLNVLADIACMSPYHWHRIYLSFYGESLVATVKRLRLQRAAGLLAKTDQTVEQIAQACGYPNVQSFTRIFSSVYGMPPAKYRREGSHVQFFSPQYERSDTMFTVEIKEIPHLLLLGIPHRGDYMGVGQAFDQLQGVAAARQLFGPNSRSIGIYWDDPSLVDEQELRSCACLTVSREQFETHAQAPLQTYEIAAARCAVLHYQGPYSDMHAAYQWLFGVWLPASGHEAADVAVYEEYINDPRQTAPCDLRTDIYLALRS